MSHITEFYRISAPAPECEMDDASRTKYYRRLRLQAFVSATLGYSLYYVCRTSLNVMKKPVLDSGSLDASQLGVIGSALLFAYAVGKFVNGFIADYCNIKRFMATGLIVSAVANALMGLLGLAHSVVPTAVIFVAFAVMWGLNGWAQSMGAPPAIISLSRWYPLNERGTYYGFFSASHNLGEFFSFLFVGSIVTFAGWQAGFFGSALAGATGVLVVLCVLLRCFLLIVSGCKFAHIVIDRCHFLECLCVYCSGLVSVCIICVDTTVRICLQCSLRNIIRE